MIPMTTSKYTGPWVNVSYPERTQDQVDDIETQKQHHLKAHQERRRACEDVYRTGRAREWLETLPAHEQARCRAILNQIRDKRRANTRK